MASVTIYPEHRDLLDELITSAKVKSVAGATKTGPFKEQRDAYVFAASIGLALGEPSLASALPKSRRGTTTIRDSVFLGADGAEELSCAACLVIDDSDQEFEEAIVAQLDLISDAQLQERFALLDRFAYRGFQWLTDRRGDEGSVRDLVLATLNEIQLVERGTESGTSVQDPLMDFLLD